MAQLIKISGNSVLQGNITSIILEASAMGAVLKTIQEISINITSPATTNTQTVTEVDTSKSFIIWTGSAGYEDYAGYSWASLKLTDSTTVTAQRLGTTQEILPVTGFLVEFESGISVQRGTKSISIPDFGTTVFENIGSVDTSRSIIIVNFRTGGTVGGTYDGAHFPSVTFNSSTQLKFYSRQQYAETVHIEWQVVEFE